MDDTFLGLIAVVIAAVFFGSFGLPIRSKKVQSLNLHPLVFQVRQLSAGKGEEKEAVASNPPFEHSNAANSPKSCTSLVRCL